jgi:hypothetical protein
MKLMTVTCAGMLSARDDRLRSRHLYPDGGSIAKTGPAPEKGAEEKAAQENGAASTGVLGTVLETITGRPSSTKEEASPMNTPEKPAPRGDTSYPDRGSIATTPGTARIKRSYGDQFDKEI